MAYRIAISELGVANDGAVIEGSTPGDVWREVARHLKDKHNIKIPDLDDLGGEGVVLAVPRFDNAAIVGGHQAPVMAGTGALDTDDDGEARLIVTRLVEKLHVGAQDSGSSDIVPPGEAQSRIP